ncbi:MAG TPA: SOS response-associated peptidase family protein [Candidatus Omnitrophota bacterium]|nr:SOS response-associated peptidase family protein [Candidatus Omnitrophota bacterium]HQO59148.1 SOS response-associated peptidase family protein [Candidatus Omnitrophota bacterium]
MCGRYSLIKKKKELQARFGVQVQLELFPQYNIAPQQDVVIIRNTSPGDITRCLRRGPDPSGLHAA